MYHEKWIGRFGPTKWPPRSPHLTSPDFYLWDYLKNVMYKETPTTREDMKNRIKRACNNIPRRILLSIIIIFRNGSDYVYKRMVIEQENNIQTFIK